MVAGSSDLGDLRSVRCARGKSYEGFIQNRCRRSSARRMKVEVVKGGIQALEGA